MTGHEELVLRKALGVAGQRRAGTAAGGQVWPVRAGRLQWLKLSRVLRISDFIFVFGRRFCWVRNSRLAEILLVLDTNPLASHCFLLFSFLVEQPAVLLTVCSWMQCVSFALAG